MFEFWITYNYCVPNNYLQMIRRKPEMIKIYTESQQKPKQLIQYYYKLSNFSQSRNDWSLNKTILSETIFAWMITTSLLNFSHFRNDLSLIFEQVHILIFEQVHIIRDKFLPKSILQVCKTFHNLDMTYFWTSPHYQR